MQRHVDHWAQTSDHTKKGNTNLSSLVVVVVTGIVTVIVIVIVMVIVIVIVVIVLEMIFTHVSVHTRKILLKTG